MFVIIVGRTSSVKNYVAHSIPVIRSAELHSAVSPIFNRQGVQKTGATVVSRNAEFNSAIRRIANPRYRFL
jgi:hypothetical protein